MNNSVAIKSISTLLLDSPHVEEQFEETFGAEEEADNNVLLCPHCVLLS
jgi:hypothetical protein